MRSIRIYILLLSNFLSLGFQSQTTVICGDTAKAYIRYYQLGDFIYSFYDFKLQNPQGSYAYYSLCKPKNGVFKEIETSFLNGKKNGIEKHYYNLGKKGDTYIQAVIGYKEGKYDGKFKVFSPNGSTLYQGEYNDGRMNGFFIEYDPHKLKNIIINISFYKNDTLIKTINYKNDE